MIDYLRLMVDAKALQAKIEDLFPRPEIDVDQVGIGAQVRATFRGVESKSDIIDLSSADRDTCTKWFNDAVDALLSKFEVRAKEQPSKRPGNI